MVIADALLEALDSDIPLSVSFCFYKRASSSQLPEANVTLRKTLLIVYTSLLSRNRTVVLHTKRNSS